MGGCLRLSTSRDDVPTGIIVERCIETRTLSAIQATFFIRDDCRHLEVGDEWFLSFSLGRRIDNVKASYANVWPAGWYGFVGDVLFVPPNQYLLSQIAEPHQRAQRTLQLRVRHALTEELRYSWDADILRQTLDVRNERVTEACLRIAAEMASPGLGDVAMIEGLAVGAMLELSRQFSRAEATMPKRGGLAPWQQRRINERLMDGAASPNLSELADHCRISPRHLTRTFKEQNGCTIGEYAAVMRTRKAQKLLRDGALTIGDVARRLGYSSHALFSTAFRKTTGMRPSEYRRLKISNHSWS